MTISKTNNSVSEPLNNSVSEPVELIRIERFDFAEEWTRSRLYLQGKAIGYIVEDRIREGEKVHGKTAIPEGFYPLALRYSPKFSSSYKWSEKKKILVDSRLAKDQKKYPPAEYLFKDHNLIWLQDVPNFRYILLHWGNTDLDSDGCLIVGSALGTIRGRDGVLSSRDFYKKLYPRVMPLIAQGGWGIKIVNQKHAT